MSLRPIIEPYAFDSELDLDLAAVWRAAREPYLSFLNDLHNQEEDCRYLSEVLFPVNLVWIAESDYRPVGFIAFANGWLNQLYIAPDFQRHGLGRQFLNLAKASHPTLHLWIFEVNRPALQFYECQGFHVIRRTNGSTNEARRADILLEWQAPALSRPSFR